MKPERERERERESDRELIIHITAKDVVYIHMYMYTYRLICTSAYLQNQQKILGVEGLKRLGHVGMGTRPAK